MFIQIHKGHEQHDFFSGGRSLSSFIGIFEMLLEDETKDPRR